MPKITFYNLPDQKKKKLIEVLHEEFSRVPLNEASISNMIRAAGIPRGSFYQYFQDKTDAFLFMLEQVAKEEQARFLEMLEQMDGDLFKAFAAFFRIFLEDETHIQLLQNTFLNMNLDTEHVMEGIFTGDGGKDRELGRIKPMLSGKFQSLDDKDLEHLLNMLVAITFHHIVRKFSNDVPLDQAVDYYKRELSLLQLGIEQL